VARVIAEGQDYSRLSPEQIKAIAQARESEALAKEDKISFMKEVEDRERGDAYRRQELDAKLMDAAKPIGHGCEREEVFALRGDGADAGELLRGVWK